MARLGRYEIIKTLAKGALTDLHVGRASGMEGFQRYVAIKRLLPEYASDPACIEAFVSEARLAAVLHHHNIVQVHDIGEANGQPYFAMEFVHGVDLRTLLGRLAKRNEQLPLQHVVSIVASAAAALHHAHEQRGPDGQPLGIVHRDVTPANILVGYDGNVKVVDFGIAKAAIKQMASDAGVIKGQAPYMSPEQCAGKSIDRRSDIFALGIVLYELATVRRLFKGASDFLTMSAIVNAEVPRPSQYRRDIPSQLEAIMLKALARDPRERFQTAGDMSLALDKIASQVGVGASTTALANYMRLQFGDQKEPWLKATPSFDDETTDVDFDGGASGLAPPPAEAVERMAIPRLAGANKSSPIAAARSHAITPTPIEKARLPLPPPRLKGSTQPPPLHADLDRFITPPDVDPHGPTEINPVVRAVGSSPGVAPNDATQLVSPLPTTGPQYVVPRRRSSRPVLLLLFAVLVGGASVAAVVFWPGATTSPSAAQQVETAAPTPAPSVEPAPVAPAAVETPPPAAAPEPAGKSGMEMTYADYERERAKQAELDAATAAAAAELEAAAERERQALAEPKTKAEPIAKVSTPAKRTTTKAPPKRTVAKPVATKTTTATKPPPTKKPAAKKPAKKTWNPDELFLDDK